MKILVISDTHGNFDLINDLASAYQADACIHCGDAGFFDRQWISTLPAEELAKIIRHAPVWKNRAAYISSLPVAEQREIVIRHDLAGNFHAYLAGSKKFAVPLYAVWGNHEDISIIRRLQNKPLPGLTLLDEKTSVKFGDIRFCGIGGNFHGKHLAMAEKNGIPVVGNQICSTFWQYRKLVQMLDEFPDAETRILVTHCDPAEQPFLEALAYRCQAQLTFSGHMHRQAHSFRRSCGSADALFRSYREKYPSLPWEKMADEKERTVEHWNLSPAKPLILEIDGTQYQVQNI